MAISCEEARAACVAHYAKRVMDVDYWERIIPTDPEIVYRIYEEIQKEKEMAKQVGKRLSYSNGALQVHETYLTEDEEPVGSQE